MKTEIHQIPSCYLRWRTDEGENDGQDDEPVENAGNQQSNKDDKKIFYNEVKLGKGEHDEAEKAAEGSIENRHESIEKRAVHPLIARPRRLEKHETKRRGEFDGGTDGNDDRHAGNRAELNAGEPEKPVHFDGNRRQHDNHDDARPSAQEKQGRGEKARQENETDGEEKTILETDVLLVEGKRRSARVRVDAVGFRRFANRTRLFDKFDEVERRGEAVSVHGHLRVSRRRRRRYVYCRCWEPGGYERTEIGLSCFVIEDIHVNLKKKKNLG